MDAQDVTRDLTTDEKAAVGRIEGFGACIEAELKALGHEASDEVAKLKAAIDAALHRAKTAPPAEPAAIPAPAQPAPSSTTTA